MRAVLPNCHSLPEAWGYPGPLQPPLSPSLFPACGWTFSGSVHLVSQCNGHLQLIPKQCPDLSSPAPTPNSSLGVQPRRTFQGSGGSFLTDTTPSSSHFRATVPQIQQRTCGTWSTYRCLHKCRWSNAAELSHSTLRLPFKHTHKSLSLLFVWLEIGK